MADRGEGPLAGWLADMARVLRLARRHGVGEQRAFRLLQEIWDARVEAVLRSMRE